MPEADTPAGPPTGPPPPDAAGALRWLDRGPTLDALQAGWPQEWERVQRELAAVTAEGDIEALKAHVLARVGDDGRTVGAAGRRGQAAVLARVRRQMLSAALRVALLEEAAGGRESADGRVRFGLLNGMLAQRLLFDGPGLVRKPVSMTRFRLLWPLLRQRRLLMPLVVPQGIYCFYSRTLIRRLADLLEDRETLEIAAGDGTLSRFLAAEGVDIVATDDRSWSHAVRSWDGVERQDAAEAVRERRPQAVICSWPPAGSRFEAEVLRTPSVELYVVLGTRHHFGAGDRDLYETQTDFTVESRPDLARVLLPPETDPEVLVLRRRSATAPAAPT